MTIGQASITVLKNVARPTVHGARHLVRNVKGVAKLASVNQDLRRRHPRLITTIDARNEM